MARWRDRRFTAVLITYDVAEAVALADRVLVLRDGGIVLDQAGDLPRPRPPGAAAALHDVILAAV